MAFSRTAAVVLLLCSLTGTAFAGLGIGGQADMMCQGLALRASSGNGLTFEVVAHGRASDTDTFEYAAMGELRLFKIFNPENRVRFYAGGGAGAWMSRDKEWHYEYDPVFISYYTLENRWGISAAAIFGLDIVVIEMDDGSGITVMPEVQVGYYTRQYIEDIWIGPGAGIGFRYVW